MSPDEYCRERAAPAGSTLHYSFRLLPADRRRALNALHAFYREIGQAVGGGADHGVTRVKLAWWRGEIAAVYEGTPSHPVALALQASNAPRHLARAGLEAVIDGAGRDLECDHVPDFPALAAHCTRIAGGIGAMSAAMLGHSDPATLDHARELGVAVRLIEIIRDVGRDARHGRIYVPRDELDRFEVPPNDILAGRDSPRFTALIAMQAERARAAYRRALAGLPAVDSRAQRPALAAAAIHRTLLDEIARDGYRVLERRVALTPLRKLAIATWVLWTGRAG